MYVHNVFYTTANIINRSQEEAYNCGFRIDKISNSVQAIRNLKSAMRNSILIHFSEAQKLCTVVEYMGKELNSNMILKNEYNCNSNFKLKNMKKLFLVIAFLGFGLFGVNAQTPTEPSTDTNTDPAVETSDEPADEPAVDNPAEEDDETQAEPADNDNSAATPAGGTKAAAAKKPAAAAAAKKSGTPVKQNANAKATAAPAKPAATPAKQSSNAKATASPVKKDAAAGAKAKPKTATKPAVKK